MGKTVATTVLWFLSGWTLGNILFTLLGMPWVVVPLVAATTMAVFAFVIAPRIGRQVG